MTLKNDETCTKKSKHHEENSEEPEVDSVAETSDGNIARPRNDELSELEEMRQALEKLTKEKTKIETKYEGLVTKLQAKVECPVCFDVPKKAQFLKIKTFEIVYIKL